MVKTANNHVIFAVKSAAGTTIALALHVSPIHGR